MTDQHAILDETRIVWVDVESTGLYPSEGSRLLQVAGIVTNGHLEEVGEPYEAKVYYSKEDAMKLRASSVAFVQDMHDKTNLWEKLSEGKSLRSISHEMLLWLGECGVGERQARLGGNSITLDRMHLGAELPEVLEYLHYRSLDMSTLTGWFDLYRPEIGGIEKESTHEALDDIRESIREARHWRSMMGELG